MAVLCLCDAFVQLDGERRIESTSKSLAAMLFMQVPLGGEGKSFIELIPHEEVKDRLRSIINKTVATSTSAECLHAFLPAVVLCVSTAAVGRSLQHSVDAWPRWDAPDVPFVTGLAFLRSCRL